MKYVSHRCLHLCRYRSIDFFSISPPISDRFETESVELVPSVVHTWHRHAMRNFLHRMGALLRLGERFQTGGVGVQFGFSSKSAAVPRARRSSQKFSPFDFAANAVRRSAIEETDGVASERSATTDNHVETATNVRRCQQQLSTVRQSQQSQQPQREPQHPQQSQ